MNAMNVSVILHGCYYFFKLPARNRGTRKSFRPDTAGLGPLVKKIR